VKHNIYILLHTCSTTVRFFHFSAVKQRNNWSTLTKRFICTRFEKYTAIDWCCFYLFVRNSLVAFLEALCARIFSSDSWYRYFLYFWCAYARSLTKPFFHPSQTGSCAWLSPFLLCADCTYVLVSVCYVRIWIRDWWPWEATFGRVFWFRSALFKNYCFFDVITSTKGWQKS